MTSQSSAGPVGVSGGEKAAGDLTASYQSATSAVDTKLTERLHSGYAVTFGFLRGRRGDLEIFCQQRRNSQVQLWPFHYKKDVHCIQREIELLHEHQSVAFGPVQKKMFPC